MAIGFSEVFANYFWHIYHLIQAHNKAGNSWETMGISLGFDILEKFGVKFLKYRVGEELTKDET